MRKVIIVLIAAMLLVGMSGGASAGIWTYDQPATTDTQTVEQSGDGYSKKTTMSTTTAIKAIYIGPTLPSWWPWGS